jgi:hypothetical protein
MKNTLLTACLLVVTGCTKSDGYKIVSYVQPPNEGQPTFTIIHQGVTITAVCQDYYGSHVGCDQLRRQVGNIIPNGQMRFLSVYTVEYQPNGTDQTCNETCEFMSVTEQRSAR